MTNSIAFFLIIYTALSLMSSLLTAQSDETDKHSHPFLPSHLKSLEQDREFPTAKQMKARSNQGRDANWEEQHPLMQVRQRGPYHNSMPLTPNVDHPTSPSRGYAQSLPDSVQQAWVSHYASGLVLSDDRARAIAMDDSGNIYVTGLSKGSGTGYDYATVKYNGQGVKQWVSRYNGPGNDRDIATAITLDALGNVYVTGSSYGSDTDYDYATVKYSSSGTEQWVSRYNGLGNDDDEPSAVAVDALGNVYVTGSSYGSGTDYDYATVKYSSSGVEQWVSRYDGPGIYDDWAYALTVDTFGNAYVTGGSRDSGTSYDYATIKYNSSGVEQWVSRYNGPGDNWDEAFALAVDSSGNVFVTGVSQGDYATIKYSSSGIEKWVSRFDGQGNSGDLATAIAIDISRNVYVTGESRNSNADYDYATVKYDSSGIEQWVSRYDGPGNDRDVANAVVVDVSGNVYVTGLSWDTTSTLDYATVKYNSSGVEQWVSRYDGSGSIFGGGDQARGLAIDSSGNVYVTGLSFNFDIDYDYATVKYNSSGVEQWVSRYDGPGNSDDQATDLAIDALGNIYVTGSSYGPGTFYDYATVKYNSMGIEQWVSRYDGPASFDDQASALAVDAWGNVYVTGRSQNSSADYDYATVKYDSSGVEQWVSRYGDPGLSNNDKAADLAVDGEGNAYVTGTSYSSATRRDYATIKYDNSGVEQWVSHYMSPGNSDDEAIAIALDASDNVFVTGSSQDDYATVKYTSTGVEQWVSYYNGPGGNHIDESTALAVDTSGNVFVTGRSEGAGTGYDYATVKYNGLGVEQWVSRYDGPGNNWDGAAALAVEVSGNVYVTGRSQGDYATIKYDSSGIGKWVSRYNGPGNSDDLATAIAIDNSGNVYVTGIIEELGSFSDFATVKYNSSGVGQWVSRYDSPENYNDRAVKLAVDALGNVYVTGSSFSENWSSYTTIKYTQIPTSVSAIGPSVPTGISLFQNYPNPFNPTTTISYQLPFGGKVELSIYNILGQQIRTLVNAQQPVGAYKMQWDGRDDTGKQVGSGIYFYRLKAGNDFLETKKMVLLR